MPTYQVRNRRTKMVLGEVSVAEPEMVIDELKDATGSSIDEIARSLGATLEEARAALDIVEVGEPKGHRRGNKMEFVPLPRRQMFG